MTAAVPGPHLHKSGEVSSVALEGGEAELREVAIASLKRKRKFVQDAYGYVTVNGVLWLIWVLTDRSVDGGMPWPAWVSAVWGFLLALDAWRAFGRWPASLTQPITEADIRREMMQSRECHKPVGRAKPHS